MNRLTLVLGAVLAVALVVSGAAKRPGLRTSRVVRDRLGISDGAWGLVGTLEAVGALGVLFGLAVPWIGILTVIGLIILLTGGICAHLLVDDARHTRTLSALLIVVVVQGVLFAVAV